MQSDSERSGGLFDETGESGEEEEEEEEGEGGEEGEGSGTETETEYEVEEEDEGVREEGVRSSHWVTLFCSDNYIYIINVIK